MHANRLFASATARLPPIDIRRLPSRPTASPSCRPAARRRRDVAFVVVGGATTAASTTTTTEQHQHHARDPTDRPQSVDEPRQQHNPLPILGGRSGHARLVAPFASPTGAAACGSHTVCRVVSCRAVTAKQGRGRPSSPNGLPWPLSVARHGSASLCSWLPSLSLRTCLPCPR